MKSHFNMNILFSCNVDVFINFKCGSKYNVISNNEENVIYPANILSLWSTLQLLRGVDHKDERLAG